MGLYMVQPYEPGKIPVLMVHGLWSSPMTWMEMFNDLRSQPEIRDHYQFWFYLYPTGQPFWLSAAQLRRDLAEVREALDPNAPGAGAGPDGADRPQHGRAGLAAADGPKRRRLLEAGQHASRSTQIKADPKARQKLQETFFFQPNPSIRRVVTIGTPHRGSTFSNQTTQWLLDKLIHLPQTIWSTASRRSVRDNPGAFPDGSLLKVDTSIDSLSPSSPIFPVMLAAHRPPWVKYHNIVGVVPKQWCVEAFGATATAWCRQQRDTSTTRCREITVPADHTTVHTHPAAVLEVRRILLEHLADLRGQQAASVAQRPAEARTPLLKSYSSVISGLARFSSLLLHLHLFSLSAL